MDCYGWEIHHYLNINENFKYIYNINVIHLNYYIIPNSAFFNNTSLDDNDISLLKSADILILQVIEKDRGFLNNDNVISFTKN